MFRSFAIFNYRVWASGALVSNIGTWMQRTAQDWIVLTQLTDQNAAALGVVVALQFGPQVLLLPITGFAADHLDRRKLLMATQGAMGLLALGLGLLTIGGHVQLWQVFVFAFLLGCVAAFDSPARQTFVGDLVGQEHISNAVALNSTSFNLGRLIGPAIAGLLIAALGSGWVFLINAASFAAVLCSLSLLRVGDLQRAPRAPRVRGSFVEGFRYIRTRPDLITILVMLFLVGAFGLNFPIYLSTMSVSVFGVGAGAFGLLSSAMAVGSILGALLAARRARPGIPLLVCGAAAFGGFLATAAIMPTYVLFAVVLIFVGAATQTLMTSAIGVVQLATDVAMRGRVMAILLAVVLGGTPLGAPIVGWLTNELGPRWAMGFGALSGIAAAGVGSYYVMRSRNLRLRDIGPQTRERLTNHVERAPR
jgi:MFS family permease